MKNLMKICVVTILMVTIVGMAFTGCNKDDEKIYLIEGRITEYSNLETGVDLMIITNYFIENKLLVEAEPEVQLYNETEKNNAVEEFKARIGKLDRTELESRVAGTPVFNYCIVVAEAKQGSRREVVASWKYPKE
ncbi:MAG: hypothetical protein ACRC9X_08890 [Bacteroidales bacterium]